MTQVMHKPTPRVPTKQELEDVYRMVDKAKSLLYLDHPFFGATVAKRPIIYTDRVATAAMAAGGQMYINPLFILEGWGIPLTGGNIIFLLAHEALHFMLCHALRVGDRDHRAWNIACDKVINDTLADAKVGEMIEGGCWFDGARDHSAEELYDEAQDGRDGPYGDQPIGGTGEDVGRPCNVNGTPLDEGEIKEIETRTKIEAIQSAKAAKAVGKLPASVERMIEELVNVSTPWHIILERFMSGKIKDGYSWQRPNRRFIHQGLYLPGSDYKPKMGSVVIGVDTSGSIGQKELNEFNGHVNRILDTCNPEMVYVVYCDAEVNHVDEYEPSDFPVKLEPHGGGGTAFEPVFNWVDDNGIEAEAIVYLTDGYGDQNHFTTKHETVWLTTHSEDFNWGTVIKFESEEV